MGNCSSDPYASDPQYSEQYHCSRVIDCQIKEERFRMAKEVKILLLGAGASGKSTVLKQMKILHDQGFSEEEMDFFRRQIFRNLYEGVQACLRIMEREGIQLADVSLLNIVSRLFQFGQLQPGEPYPCHLLEPLSRLLMDVGIREALARDDPAMPETVLHFFPQLNRLFKPSYVPTEQDVLRCRAVTIGITETKFDVAGLIYKMVDVGGQRSERRKWIHCFDQVTTIIFLVAISGYDTKVAEADDSNQVHEALMLFEAITNSQWFNRTSIILFMNKIDLLKKKILHSPVSWYFPDYKGTDSDFESCKSYFTKRFLALNKSSRSIYTHYTCATDTALMRAVMTSVTDIILKRSLLITLV